MTTRTRRVKVETKVEDKVAGSSSTNVKKQGTAGLKTRSSKRIGNIKQESEKQTIVKKEGRTSGKQKRLTKTKANANLKAKEEAVATSAGMRTSKRLASKKEEKEAAKVEEKSEDVEEDEIKPGLSVAQRREMAAVSLKGKQQHLQIRQRAMKERMYFLSQLARGEDEDEALFVVTGQTGTIYTVRLPVVEGGRGACNCLDHIFRKRACKHILFVAHRVLKVDDASGIDDRMSALSKLSAQFDEIAAAAARLRQGGLLVDGAVAAPSTVQRAFEMVVPASLLDKRETPVVAVAARAVQAGEECPICYDALDADSNGAEAIVHCARGCGKPVHADCMQRYKRSVQTGDLRCVLCRAPWGLAAKDGEGEVEDLRRGVLTDGRLIDLSVLTAEHFVQTREPTRRRRALVSVTQDSDGVGDQMGRNADAEERAMMVEQQKSARTQRARKRGRSGIDDEAGDDDSGAGGRTAKTRRSGKGKGGEQAE